MATRPHQELLASFNNFYVSLGGKPQKVLVISFYLKGDILRFLPKPVKASYVHVYLKNKKKNGV